MDEEFRTFVVHVAALKAPLAGMAIHFSQKARISALIQNETFTKVPPKYVDYADVSSFDLAMELPKNISIKEYAIKLHDGK